MKQLRHLRGAKFACASRRGLYAQSRIKSESLPARERRSEKRKNPAEVTQRGLCSGDVLLSHNLSSHYHRGCSVSLPCSEWERVGPLRYDHQSAEPHGHFAAFAARP